MPLASASEEVQRICQELCPPHLLLLLDSWWYPKGDYEDSHREAAQRREVVRGWVNESAPALLQRLYDVLNEEILIDLNLELRSSIVVATSIYVSARRDVDGSKATLAGREPWITPQNTRLAKAALQALQARSGSSTDFELMEYILVHYLKPLFSSSTPLSINANTGRAAPAISNLSGSATALSGGTLMEDELIWKGGESERGERLRILGQKVSFAIVSEEPILQSRHRALGCFNVFYYCCQTLRNLLAKDPSIMERIWPLLLPPLLTLLEDTAPLYRLIGSRILTLTLLHEDQSSIGTLLLRTGVEPLLRERLESNLTYINTTLSAALLQSSSEALLLLTQATTSTLHLNQPSPRNAIHDGGKLRYKQLSNIIDSGVLRVWAYATASITDAESGQKFSDVRALGDAHGEAEASDTINASIEVLIRMAQQDALGIGICRYLDVMLEFLTAQLLALEVKYSRHNAMEQKKLSLDREICCARAIETLLSICRDAPGIKLWSARCLTTVARTWVILQNQQDDEQVGRLRSYLQGIVKALSIAEPILLKDLSGRLLGVDKGAFSTMLNVD